MEKRARNLLESSSALQRRGLDFRAFLFLASFSIFSFDHNALASDPTSDPKIIAIPDSAQIPQPVSVPLLTSKGEVAARVSLSSSIAKDGSIVAVSILTGEESDSESIRVEFEGAAYPIYPNGQGLGALIAVPYDSKPRESKIQIKWREKGATDDQIAFIPLTVVDGNYEVDEKIEVAKDKVEPPQRSMKRILREQKEIGTIYREITKKRYWSGAFNLPINSEKMSKFGTKRIYNGKKKSPHLGLDLRARTPVPIYAPEGARVAMAKDLYFTGKTVILDHGYGLFTIYAHMSKLRVKVGDEIPKGKQLGLSGATGRITGPHLHWGAVLMRQKFNPEDLVQALR